MRMLVYRPSQAAPTEFVEFWRRIYGDNETEKLYSENIRRELTEKSILQLFEWKNGSRLSSSKRHLFARIL
jgi:cephalosporin-C deacetylase-like acetyl esterase